MRRVIQTASLFTIFTIFALASSLSACKKEEPAGGAGGAAKTEEGAGDPATGLKPGSCDYRNDTGVCTFNKETSADLCTALGGKFIDGPCPTEGVLGTCVSPGSSTEELKSYYPTSAAKYTAETAKLACEAQQGMWTATGGAAAAAAPTVGACTVKADKSCSETKLNNPGDSATYGKMCTDDSKGTWAEGPCPMEKAIGECNSASAGRTVYYKGAKDAKHTCEQMVMGGVYTAL